MSTTSVTQKVTIVNGCYTPAEASEIVESMIEGKINFHKVKRLQQWLGDCNCENADSKQRIQELSNDFEKAQAFFAEARQAGKKVVITGNLQMSLED